MAKEWCARAGDTAQTAKAAAATRAAACWHLLNIEYSSRSIAIAGKRTFALEHNLILVDRRGQVSYSDNILRIVGAIGFWSEVDYSCETVTVAPQTRPNAACRVGQSASELHVLIFCNCNCNFPGIVDNLPHE
ncbi:hypothetical protein GGQ88_000592 [Novosphingobium hassiacum]|uniref:Uncharacterized protein n=1 Tax=Novosphingobium hassiacum TaxID=173676 RepID=A0A7W6EUM7_9SPHN|nr:hypothetical protein [Novosphingobium hassiacum]MBB3859352.1 hypothetical protein [Novosphingobium hassiacum]